LLSRWKIAALETSQIRKMSATSFQVNPLRELPDMVLLLSIKSAVRRRNGVAVADAEGAGIWPDLTLAFVHEINPA
jgi:hypothetical protein